MPVSKNAPLVKPSAWFNARASGVLAHISSLPGEFGIGNLGQPARHFVDFLAEAGFHYWQICPLGPTGYGDSPYQSFSSFAGNPYFIDLQELIDHGLLKEREVARLRSFPGRNVHYGALYQYFWRVLEMAYARFRERSVTFEACPDFEEYCAAQAEWFQPYGLFMGLKLHFGGRPWNEWPQAFRDAPLQGYMNLPENVHAEARQQAFYQYVFDCQWQRLRAYAADKSVEIIGDLPIFVALDSSDTWCGRDIFRISPEGEPLASAGVPPDYFSDRGQFWGNPLYDWEALKNQDYEWWAKRLQRVFDMFDVIRLDHFRGFDTYWEIPQGSEDARTGSWQAGPGLTFLQRMKEKVPQAKIIAEDLGYITEGVFYLRKAAGLPGMKIMQFAYGHDDNNVNLPHFHPQDSVVYSGTHDNNTVRGWLEHLQEPEASQVRSYFGLKNQTDAWPIISATMASPARLAIIALQDLLNLGSMARMNRPGTSEGNWVWRCTEAELRSLRKRKLNDIRQLHQTFDRYYDTRQRDYSAPPGES